MKVRGLVHVGSGLGMVLVPLAALGQAVGTVVTAPFGAAPAVGMPVLVVLALALSVAAAYVLRRRAATARLAVMATATIATILAGIAYATINTVVVSGDECHVRTSQTWTPISDQAVLQNQCAEALLIVAIDVDCRFGDTFGSAQFNAIPACVVGETLAAGATCNLPFCV